MRLMEIVYLGHSSFRIKGKKTTLLTDPYNPDAVGFSYKKVSADIVTISHQHDDHNYLELVTDVKRVVDGPGEYEISGVSIIGISSYHDDKQGKERGKNTIYVIEMDGLRLVHMGDLGHTLKEKEVEALGTIDILMIPTGGEYTIGPAQASEITRAIEPSITIPMHYKTAGLTKDLSAKLSEVAPFISDLGFPVEKVDKLSVKRESLGEEQKIIVLEKRLK